MVDVTDDTQVYQRSLDSDIGRIKSALLRLGRFHDRNYYWMNPLFTVSTAVFGSFATYDYSKWVPSSALGKIAHDILSEYIAFIVVLSGTVLLISLIRRHIEQKTIDQLETDNIELRNKVETLSDRIEEYPQNVHAVLKSILYLIGNELQFGAVDKNCERISLHVYNPARQNFKACGVWSPNPKYDCHEQLTCTAHKGFVSKVWEQDWYFDDKFTGNSKIYNNRQANEYGYSKEEINRLIMRSKVYGGLKIFDPAHKEALAVILVESTTNARFSEEQLRGKLSQQSPYISEMITLFRSFLLSDAVSAQHEGV